MSPIPCRGTTSRPINDSHQQTNNHPRARRDSPVGDDMEDSGTLPDCGGRVTENPVGQIKLDSIRFFRGVRVLQQQFVIGCFQHHPLSRNPSSCILISQRRPTPSAKREDQQHKKSFPAKGRGGIPARQSTTFLREGLAKLCGCSEIIIAVSISCGPTFPTCTKVR
jgi:hypothetical protein